MALVILLRVVIPIIERREVIRANIERYLSSSGYSQKEVAEKLGVSKSSVTNWIKGKNTPDVNLVVPLCELLGITVLDLFSSDTEHSSFRHTENAPDITPEALKIAKDYDGLPAPGQRLVRVVIDELQKGTADAGQDQKPATRIIPLFGNRMAAGPGEPDFGNSLEKYEVPADSPADFAVRVHGDSMEPWLPDGSIQLCVKGTPKDGDVAVLYVDGDYYVKQICLDSFHNLYMFSLNRARKDMDKTVWASGENTVECFGTVIMKERVPLPVD